jgi:hypothetical protein
METLTSYWNNRPWWLGGPAQQTEPTPAPVSTAVGGRHRRAFRNKNLKIRRPRLRRRRTGRKSNHP